MFANGGVSVMAEEYFQSLNPMASRVMEDIAAVRQAYNDKWDDLNLEDKDRIICDSFIGNEAKQRYSCYPHNKPDYESFPRLSIRSGEKYIVDDETQSKSGTGHSWRDEHSGPFSWETQSQLDLSFTDDKKQKRSVQQQMRSKPSLQEQKHGCFLETFCPCAKEAEVKPKAPRPPPRKPSQAITISEEATLIVSQTVPQAKQEPAVVKADPAISVQVPEQQPVKIVNDNLESPEDPDIPRTGFDFLDNW